MAKKIKWTTHSILDRKNHYQYWLMRNQSDIYPEELEQLFDLNYHTKNVNHIFSRVFKK